MTKKYWGPDIPGSNFYAPIAEYRNVALMERKGDKRAVWEGKEYFTDGYVYIPFLDNDDHGAMAFESERDVKEFIDFYLDHPETIPADVRKDHLLSWKEIWEYIKKDYAGDTPLYVFNEAAGVFVEVSAIRDGSHRHGKKG